jgi:glycosyltransferase involved in cell wall biosynthesis
MMSVAGDAACLVDPSSVVEIHAGILKLITNDQYREQLIKAGFENVKFYSPHNTAEQYAQLYLSLLE